MPNPVTTDYPIHFCHSILHVKNLIMNSVVLNVCYNKNKTNIFYNKL